MVMLKNTKIAKIVVAVLVGVPVFGVVLTGTNANGISKACQNSAACREAVEKEQEATKNAASAANSANMFQAKVNELTAEIAGKEAEIAETEAEVRALKTQIEVAEAKLLEEQEALAELLVTMHFESDAEPINL